jgi:general secretion pathway protein D
MRGLRFEISPIRVTAWLTVRSAVGRAGLAGVCVCAALGSPLVLSVAAQDGGVASLAEREIARRDASIREASALVQQAQVHRRNRDLAAAVDSYQQALNILPIAPATASLRAQVLRGFAEVSTARAEELAALARYEDANRTLDAVLQADRVPDFAPALRLKEQIQDPEYFNPAATPAHLENVQKVKEQLTLAEGHVALGNFDQARDHYHRALAIDRTNTAARRGLERIERRISEHHLASRDHTRAAALREVDQQWETQVPRLAGDIGGFDGVDRGGSPDGFSTAREKMRTIILPQVQLLDATLEEVVQFLAMQSKNYDTQEPDPSRKGVNIVLGGDATLAAKRISLNLTEVPLAYVLETAASMAGTQVRAEDYLIVIGPSSESNLVTQKFRVPPGFFSTSPVSATTTVDPFAVTQGAVEGGAATGLSFARISPEDMLRSNGLTFPEGAAAFFSPVTGELTVRNTPANLDLVRQLVEDASAGVTKLVKIRSTMLEMNQETVEELGFDWLVGQFNMGGGGVFGGGGTSGNQPGGDQQSLSQNFPFIPPGQGQLPVGASPLTAGNRSGNSALQPNSLDALLAGRGNDNLGAKAPAVFAVSGVLTDPQFQVVFRALNQKKGVDLSSSPEVITKSGQRAKVEVTREFIYPTEFEPPEIPQDFGGGTVIAPVDLGGGQIGLIGFNTGFQGGAFPVTPTTPTAFTMQKLGSILEVEATVGADNRTIELDVAPAFKEFEGFINYGTPITTIEGNQRIVLTENRIVQPVFRSNRASGLNVTLWSGNTMVIAGLAGEERTTVNDKTPVLGDLPYVGRFFRSKAESVRQKVIIFLVTAEVVDPSGEPPPAVMTAAGN